MIAMRRHRHGKGSAGAEKAAPAPARTCMMQLGDVDTGCTGTISKLECRRQLKRRLMDMGVVAGTRFKIEKVAPLGDPMELKFNGFNLSLRKAEAGDIWVEVPCD